MPAETDAIRLGLVGYGFGGRFFHAPFVDAADGIELVGVVTRSPERRAELANDFPGLPVFDSPAQMYSEAQLDAVTITTPPETRRDLVLEALAHGLHVVADKPFAPSADVGRELAQAAVAAGLILNVFHNRRWDADIRTLRHVLDTGLIGTVWRIESRFDLDSPETLEAGPTGGLLRDVGSHLVDQALWLLGPAERVYASLDWIDQDAVPVDCGFTIMITHQSGTKSLLTCSKLNHMVSRSLRAYGTHGGYHSDGTDVQSQALFAGGRPRLVGAAWGYEKEDRWGVLSTSAGDRAVPSEQGAYQRFYEEFAEAIRVHGEGPVPAEEGVATLAVLDAARQSAEEGRAVYVG